VTHSAYDTYSSEPEELDDDPAAALCDDSACTDNGNDCCAPGTQPRTCSGGLVPVDLSGLCFGRSYSSYTCCPVGVVPRGGSPSWPLDATAEPPPQTEPLIIDFHASGGVLKANGHPFYIKGISWFGSEHITGRAPFGLHANSLDFYMHFLASQGFNAIRLFFNHESIVENKLIPEHITGWGSTDYNHVKYAPELIGTTQVGMFKKIARAAAKRYILVMLVSIKCTPHSKRHEKPGGLWYEPTFPESRVLQSWTTIARELCSQWNIFAMDLQNEPWAASWGDGSADTDWVLGASRLGNNLQTHCSRWLLFVEGVGNKPGANGKSWEENRIPFWGENFRGARDATPRLQNKSKLIYSPHVYGPSVYSNKPYFNDWAWCREWERSGCTNSFPHNLGQLYKDNFWNTRGDVPIVVGEIGGWYGDIGHQRKWDPTGKNGPKPDDRDQKDKRFQDYAIAWFVQHGIGVFYFGLTADSVDTGGILAPDNRHPDRSKLQLLRRLPSSSVYAAQHGGTASAYDPVASSPVKEPLAPLPPLDPQPFVPPPIAPHSPPPPLQPSSTSSPPQAPLYLPPLPSSATPAATPSFPHPASRTGSSHVPPKRRRPPPPFPSPTPPPSAPSETSPSTPQGKPLRSSGAVAPNEINEMQALQLAPPPLPPAESALLAVDSRSALGMGVVLFGIALLFGAAMSRCLIASMRMLLPSRLGALDPAMESHEPDEGYAPSASTNANSHGALSAARCGTRVASEHASRMVQKRHALPKKGKGKYASVDQATDSGDQLMSETDL